MQPAATKRAGLSQKDFLHFHYENFRWVLGGHRATLCTCFRAHRARVACSTPNIFLRGGVLGLSVQPPPTCLTSMKSNPKLKKEIVSHPDVSVPCCALQCRDYQACERRAYCDHPPRLSASRRTKRAHDACNSPHDAALSARLVFLIQPSPTLGTLLVCRCAVRLVCPCTLWHAHMCVWCVYARAGVPGSPGPCLDVHAPNDLDLIRALWLSHAFKCSCDTPQFASVRNTACACHAHWYQARHLIPWCTRPHTSMHVCSMGGCRTRGACAYASGCCVGLVRQVSTQSGHRLSA